MCQIGKFIRIVTVPEKNPLIGYRGFYTQVRGAWDIQNPPMDLVSSYRSYAWDTGVNSAKFASDYSTRPDKVERGNNIGFWAFNTPKHFNLSTRSYGSHNGTIKAWGRVAIHEDGFRAQFAKVASLVKNFGKLVTADDQSLIRLASRYNAILIDKFPRSHTLRDYQKPKITKPVKATKKTTTKRKTTKRR